MVWPSWTTLIVGAASKLRPFRYVHPGRPQFWRTSLTSSSTPIREHSFADLGVTPVTLTALARVGIEHPFPIQTLCLPLALAGVDLIGQARTGTGKTLAFGVPIVQEVDPDDTVVQALVVVPTRELCLQVAGDVETAGRDAGIRVVSVVGGRPIGPQVVALSEGAQVVVGTPGRLLDLLRQRSLDLSQVRILVLDAPDRDRVAVFRRTKRGVDRTIKGLLDAGYKAGALHGDLPQVVRERVMRAFRNGKLDVLVCTDVAARGLDIAGLSHVINYDTPEDERAYIHRIGRTGRAGAAGVAITFVAWNEAATADLIRQHLGLAEEPIPEVYSTSQLLVDLFGLPTVEEAAAKRAAGHPAPAKAKAKAAASASGDEEATQGTRKSGSRRRRRRRLAGPRTDASTAAVAG